MANGDELKESVKGPVKKLVKEIISDTTAKFVTTATKKAVVELRERLKKEAVERAEEKLKSIAQKQLEKRLKRSARQLEKEITKDGPQKAEYASRIKQSLDQNLKKFVSSLSKGLLKPLVIIASCALVAGVLIGWGVVYCWIGPDSPTPQPDLMILETTFEWTGESVIIHYMIENQGDADAEQSTSCLYLYEEIVAESVVNPLAAGEKRWEAFYDCPLLSEESFYAYLRELGHIDIRLSADAEKIIDESNEQNNNFTLQVIYPTNTWWIE